MAYDLSAISRDARLRPPRIVLLGVEKIGKTTFAANSDSPILLPVKGEEGADGIAVPKTPVCNSFGDVDGWLNAIGAGEEQFGMVIIDSASALEPLIWEQTCKDNGNADSIEKVNGGYGKGYVEALKYWRRITEVLDALRTHRNMGSIVIGHVKVKRFDDPAGDSYDTYSFDLNDKAANLLYRWADVILFANVKVVVKKEDVGFKKEHKRGIDITNGARFLYTQKRPAHPGGGRDAYGRLPYELPLDWVAFRDAVAAVAG